MLKNNSNLWSTRHIASMDNVDICPADASTIYLNTGVYVNELGRTTYYVAKSTPLFILYVDIFLFFLVCFGKNKMSISRDAVILESTNLSTLVCYSSLLLTIALAGYTILDMLVSGIPMMTSVITHYNYYVFCWFSVQ